MNDSSGILLRPAGPEHAAAIAALHLGGRLFTATLDLARRSGRATLSLWVVASNTPARRFYERYGMRPDGATQVHVLGPGAELHEDRYRLPLE